MILLMNLLYIFSLMNLLYIFSLTNLNIILFDQPVIILLTNLLYPQASSNCSASQQRPTFGLSPSTDYFDKFTSGIKIPFFSHKMLVVVLQNLATDASSPKAVGGGVAAIFTFPPFLIFTTFICFEGNLWFKRSATKKTSEELQMLSSVTINCQVLSPSLFIQGSQCKC